MGGDPSVTIPSGDSPSDKDTDTNKDFDQGDEDRTGDWETHEGNSGDADGGGSSGNSGGGNDDAGDHGGRGD